MNKNIAVVNKTMKRRTYDTLEIDMEMLVNNSIANEFYGANLDDHFPGNVIVKCQHCGQWCARKTACVYCGAPVD